MQKYEIKKLSTPLNEKKIDTLRKAYLIATHQITTFESARPRNNARAKVGFAFPTVIQQPTQESIDEAKRACED